MTAKCGSATKKKKKTCSFQYAQSCQNSNIWPISTEGSLSEIFPHRIPPPIHPPHPSGIVLCHSSSLDYQDPGTLLWHALLARNQKKCTHTHTRTQTAFNTNNKPMTGCFHKQPSICYYVIKFPQAQY